jgi:hypothetical protein
LLVRRTRWWIARCVSRLSSLPRSSVCGLVDALADIDASLSLLHLQEFLRPIVTPYELELALTSKAWTGDYILDFARLLSSSEFGQDAPKELEEGEGGTAEGEEGGEDAGDAPVYSATTGKYRHAKKYYQNGVKGASLLFFASVVASPLSSIANAFFLQTPTTSPPKLPPSPSVTKTPPSPAFSVPPLVRPLPLSSSLSV